MMRYNLQTLLERYDTQCVVYTALKYNYRENTDRDAIAIHS